MRGFLDVGIVRQVLVLEVAPSRICTAIINKFQGIYKSNSDIIGFDLYFDLDIVYYFIFLLYVISLLISDYILFLHFQCYKILCNQLILHS